MVRCFQTAQLSPTAMGCSTALLLHLDGVRMNAEHGGGMGLGEHRRGIPRRKMSPSAVLLPPQDKPSAVLLPPQDKPSAVAEKVLASMGAVFPRER